MKKKSMIAAILGCSFLLAGCVANSPKEGNTVPVNTDPVETTPATTQSQETITESSSSPEVKTRAVYLGVENYGAAETDIDHVDTFGYRFEADGKEHIYRIESSNNEAAGFPMQNALKEGYSYNIVTSGELLVSVNATGEEEATGFEPPVKGVPGERTLKNYISTAMMPVGNVLYIYGGGWDWQDEGSSVQAVSIGVSDDWIRFFRSKDAGYTYNSKDGKEENKDPAHSYYPYGSYNEYYYAGLDCSGYLGWTLYNTFNTENGKEGFVMKSTDNSKILADKGWGSLSKSIPAKAHRDDSSLKPGDVVSIKGHVWLSLGTCPDGSIVIAHSTPSLSREGQPGGGVQIGAIGGSKDCAAYHLADKFMSEYYPEWYKRYETTLVNFDKYFDFSAENAGIFSWNTDGKNGGLTDPDGIKEMSPKHLLNSLYKHKE